MKYKAFINICFSIKIQIVQISSAKLQCRKKVTIKNYEFQ